MDRAGNFFVIWSPTPVHRFMESNNYPIVDCRWENYPIYGNFRMREVLLSSQDSGTTTWRWGCSVVQPKLRSAWAACVTNKISTEMGGWNQGASASLTSRECAQLPSTCNYYFRWTVEQKKCLSTTSQAPGSWTTTYSRIDLLLMSGHPTSARILKTTSWIVQGGCLNTSMIGVDSTSLDGQSVGWFETKEQQFNNTIKASKGGMGSWRTKPTTTTWSKMQKCNTILWGLIPANQKLSTLKNWMPSSTPWEREKTECIDLNIFSYKYIFHGLIASTSEKWMDTLGSRPPNSYNIHNENDNSKDFYLLCIIF